MERDEFEQHLRFCPLRIRMNDGRDYVVEKPEFITIGDYTVSILRRGDDGKLPHGLFSLMNITMVEPLGDAEANGDASTSDSRPTQP